MTTDSKLFAAYEFGERAEALILGRIGLVRSLGRLGIPITLARESSQVLEKASRYVKRFIELPDINSEPEKAIDKLIQYGQSVAVKPIAFFNGESDVMLFSRNRELLGKYFRIILADHELVSQLVDKNRFWELAVRYNLPVPKTIIPNSEPELYDAAWQITFPLILKPIRQRIWHRPAYLDAIGYRKAILIKNEDELKNIIGIIPPINGEIMVQQYIPGPDANHYDYHCYIDKNGVPRGGIVGHKIRTYPIHFGQGCYTHYIDEPKIEKMCLDTLNTIKYFGAANINTKRHNGTGQDYILEINPRFSLWTIFDSLCGVNLPLMQYLNALSMEIPDIKPSGEPQRWLWLGADLKAMLNYRKSGELTLFEWLKSFFRYKGHIEYHIFAWDDPAPSVYNVVIKVTALFGRCFAFVKRRAFLN
jgi:D-aspartate ligase